MALAGVLMAALTLYAQDLKQTIFTDYQVKAAYLTDLGRFVEVWGTRAKPAPDAPFDVCVLGQDPFGGSLDAAVKGEEIGGAPVVAKRLARVQDAQSCRVLFIGASEQSQLAAILATLATNPVLTVSDMADFVKQGGMVQFVLDGNKVKFEINIAASERGGLKLSSELLKLARAVKKGSK